MKPLEPIRTADLDEFRRLLRDLEHEADALQRDLESRGERDRTGGVRTVRVNAGDLARRAEEGDLGGQDGALPLGRPFSEWRYGDEGDRVRERLHRVEDFWEDRLHGGSFVVDPAAEAGSA